MQQTTIVVIINDNVLMALSVIMLHSTWIVLPVLSPRLPQHTECRDGLVHELPSNAQHPAHKYVRIEIMQLLTKSRTYLGKNSERLGKFMAVLRKDAQLKQKCPQPKHM